MIGLLFKMKLGLQKHLKLTSDFCSSLTSQGLALAQIFEIRRIISFWQFIPTL